jgi:hypothetical protein
MKHHEREFFISMIRFGGLYIEKDNLTLLVKPLTIEQSYKASIIYNKAYEQAIIDEIMSEDEINDWMLQNGLWSKVHDNKTEGLKKDLEKLKIEIYNNRNDSKLRERIRLYIRAGEKQMLEHLREKSIYYQNSREGYALSEKISWIIKNSTYCDDKLYDFKDVSLSYIVDEWQSSVLSEGIIRELAREEPWKSLWSIKSNGIKKLFYNEDNQELTLNQKNLVIWSQIYDNIQESMDCPNDDVIKDDDLLDGWFLIQAKKREKEKLEKDFESGTRNDKIKNAGEVYVVVDPNDKDSISKVDSMNDSVSQLIKKQRFEVINQKNGAYQHDFADEKQKMQMQITNQMRNNVKGGR